MIHTQPHKSGSFGRMIVAKQSNPSYEGSMIHIDLVYDKYS